MKKRSVIGALWGLVVLCATLLTGCAALRVGPSHEEILAARYAVAKEHTREQAAKMLESGIPGVSVAVAAEGSIVFFEGFGVADIDTGTPVTTQTKFRTASLSKPLTGVALARLVQAGRIDLDDELHAWVPDFPAKEHPILVRQLACHTGGIRHYVGGELLSRTYYPTLRAGLAFFEDEPLAYEPGTRRVYTSHGFNLLGCAMEGAAGMAFAQLVEDYVCAPLGMTGTVPEFAGNYDHTVSRFYEPGEDGAILPAPVVDNAYKLPGGGYLSTAGDMARLGMAVSKPGLLDEDALTLIHTRQKLNDGEEIPYSLGFSLSGGSEDKELLAWHMGAHVGGRTILCVYTETDVVVAVMTNMRTLPLTYDMAEEIARPYRDIARMAAPDYRP